MTTFTHHHLSAEQINDEQGPAILLTQQDDYHEPSTVLVHPWQLRAACEQFGIIASDPQAARTIATLTRHLLVLAGRIEHLNEQFALLPADTRAGLGHELGHLGGTVALAVEFACAVATDNSNHGPGA